MNKQNKIKILFVIESLSLAGSEKSLIALLSNLDSNLYDVDIQLFSYGGELESLLPSYVNLLPPLSYTKFVKKSLVENILSFNLRFLWSKLTYTIRLRVGKRNVTDTAKLYWSTVHRAFKKYDYNYDIAIAYAQGVPTYYVVDKIKAQKKITWVNANLQLSKRSLSFEKKYYSQFDNIVPVSKINKQHFAKIFPFLTERLWLIPDMLDVSSIYGMADMFQVDFKKNTFNILTVSRLEKGMKGLDITMETCRLLKESGIDFHWYIIGKGSYRSEMQEFIGVNELSSHLTLLGTTTNPYPYFKAADLYVQTSRSESYGISIAEARLLNIPIVTTRFDTVYNQMIEGKNGLVTDLNPEAVAYGIIEIMKNKGLYNSIVNYLRKEPKESSETIKRFDSMISKLIASN